MLLGKPEIERYLKLGKIVIDPFVPENLGSAQYDVTLGEHFYREMNLRGMALYNPYDERHVRSKWNLDHPITHEDWIERTGVPLQNIGRDEKLIIVEPGETILAHTNEFIGGACNFITTMMKARSSMGRNFFEICKCAGMGDAGYFNRWTMEITNNSRYHQIPLVVGRRLAQLLFFKIDAVDEADVYDRTGKYQSSPSLVKLKESWSSEQMLPKQWKDRECRPAASAEWERVWAQVKKLIDDGKIPREPTREQKIDWVYGNLKIDNPSTTREFVERAYDELERGK